MKQKKKTTITDLIPQETIASKILLLRGKKVMLDRNLAKLYGVTTGNLNKAVKRNIERFPEDFMFQLTKDEEKALRFQFGSLKRGQHPKYLPYVFIGQPSRNQKLQPRKHGNKFRKIKRYFLTTGKNTQMNTEKNNFKDNL